MGTWGVSIYSCDVAEDVRDACNTVFAFFDIEEGNNRIFSAFDGIVNQSYVDNEYASFWYALSDWQWKHGMLNTYVKEKTLNLLEKYTGLDEWEGADISKRKKILDQLKEQLLKPQPAIKKPRKKVLKPKHVPGDIIVFQAVAGNEAEIYNETEIYTEWKITSLPLPLFFKSSKYRNSPCENIEGYDARGQWMAVLCIGTVKEKYSEYIDDVFNEISLYVWYDYLSYEKPSISDLCTCGFLPYVHDKWKDFNKGITEYVEWRYEFTAIYEKFKISSEIGKLVEYKIVESNSKNNRVEMVFTRKNGTYFGTYIIRYQFKIIHHELGINCRFYDLRGSFATKALRNGNEIKDISKLLDHSRIETTENYYVVSTTQDLIKICESIEKEIDINLRDKF